MPLSHTHVSRPSVLPLLSLLCAAPEWVLDRSEPSHGPVFHKWADVIMRALPHVNITVEYPHSVAYPYRWQCTNSK